MLAHLAVEGRTDEPRGLANGMVRKEEATADGGPTREQRLGDGDGLGEPRDGLLVSALIAKAP